MMFERSALLVRAMLLTAAITAALGCSTPIRVSSDFDPEADFAALETWSWVPDLPAGAGPELAANSLLKERVSGAIERTLGEKGLRRVSERPDFRVGFAFASQEKLQVRSRPTTTVHHGRVGRGRGGVYTSWSGSTVDVRQFTEGTLVIDFVEPGRDRLLWRGTGTSRIREERDPQRRTEIVNEAVAKILAQFPPKR